MSDADPQIFRILIFLSGSTVNNPVAYSASLLVCVAMPGALEERRNFCDRKGPKNQRITVTVTSPSYLDGLERTL